MTHLNKTLTKRPIEKKRFEQTKSFVQAAKNRPAQLIESLPIIQTKFDQVNFELHDDLFMPVLKKSVRSE